MNRHLAIIWSALILGICSASAQTELSKYADAKGYIDVQKLTCAQLAGTYQEDADFLGSGIAAGTTDSLRNMRSTCLA